MPTRHLYIHIPFCLKACPYCSFFKEVGGDHTPFLDALLVELEREAADLQPETIFFGGGTPSILSVGELEQLLGGIREKVDLSALTEWTLEMNPATVSTEKAEVLHSLGVNRISMGVQSWEPRILEVLGRVHSARDAEDSHAILREAGFDNINLDLMFAVPTQTREEWSATLEKTLALAPEHLSTYCLTYEEDTAFFHRFQSTRNIDWEADLFEMTLDRLGEAGYEPYEISNHARPGRECRHNLAYWESADYLGLGPSAFSTLGGERRQNIPDVASYCQRMMNGESAVVFRETLNESTRRAERIAFGLRMNRGVERALLTPWASTVEEYLSEGFFCGEGSRIRLTRKGKLVADTLAEAFV